ncbi:HYR domain-containing protein [Salegentibacter sp. JZCK2]|uniref:HYR domain-containing protein n=1 Tax=Salegentibacter tibetensis TaxID=2873600 RepID=UPI001CCB63D9|nr:HYR domain-containing protein [Salegentibacter tibetensis]MBZ9730496.1 HYR domain-containing protein [Salegentibacter tibetensis]
MKQSYSHPGYTFRLQPFSRTTALFFLFFLLNFFVGFGQEVPVYNWEKAEPMGQANASNLDQIVIATSTDTEDNIYALKFGGEVLVFDSNGDLDGSFQLEGSFEGLVDMAINSRNEIYVAHYEGREVLAFDLNGNELTNRRKSSGYFKPLGLAFDQADNLFIVDYNDGTGAESTISSRLKIYYEDGTVSSNLLMNELDQPYRIAVATSGNIYISHAANNGETLVFDENFNFLQKMSNLGSPGSIEIDHEGFIHIIDYSDKIDFAKILEGDAFYLLGALGDIRDGIDNNEFSIKLFNSDNTYEQAVRDRVQLPFDLTFTYCTDKMAVNNSNIQGASIFSRLVFELEIYNRTPSFDTENPEAVCVDDAEFTLDNGVVTITAEQIDDGSTDNCEIENIELSQYTFEEAGDFPITLTVTDTNGNIDTCETTIRILEGEEETPPEANCNSFEVTLDDNGEASITAAQVYDGNEDLELEIDKESFTCSDIGENEVELTVIDAQTGLSDTCTAIITVTDDQDPLVSCVADGKEFQLENGSVTIAISDIELSSSDNCGISTRTLSESTFTSPGTKIITLTVKDTSGNTEECSTSIEILPEEPEPYDFQCVEEYTVRLGEDAQNSSVTEIPTSEFVTSDTSNLVFTIEDQQFTCEDIGTNPLIINATNTETGETYSCPVQVTVEDVGAPLIICPAEAIIVDLSEDGYEVPDFFENRVSDNCNSKEELNLVQSPSPGTVIASPGEYTINLTATDSNNNTETCVITLILQDEQMGPEIECLNYEVFLDENGQASLDPETIYNGERDDLILSLNQEEFDCSNLGTNTVTLTATDPDTNLSSTCTAQVEVFDEISPEANCIEPGREFRLQNGSVIIPPSAIDLNSGDNCEITLSLSEDTFTTTGTKNITLYIEDSAGNTDQCTTSIEIIAEDAEPADPEYQCFQGDIPDIRLDEDCEFTVPDYSYLIETQNFTPSFEQSYEQFDNIILTTIEIFNQETEEFVGECSFSSRVVDLMPPVASCVSGFVVNLDSSGNGSIEPEDLDNNSTDNCGIVSMVLSQLDFTRADIGEVPITLTVRDEAGNMDSCDTTVEVVDTASGEFQCRENVVLNLGENGEASLNLQDLYTGDASGITFEASRLNFNCSDLGTAVIQLDYSGEKNGSCMINVEIREEIPPVIITGIVELSLNNAGFAYLEENAVLAEDNCSEELIYRFGKSVFTCKDVGINTVNVEVEDASGNVTERNIQVRISGEACEFPEIGEDEFLFLYPNPSNGVFTIATPEGMFIERVRVFDSRGRYLMQQDYNANARFYRMTIQGVEESVYTLQIFTNEGVIVKRAIIKR